MLNQTFYNKENKMKGKKKVGIKRRHPVTAEAATKEEYSDIQQI